VAFHTRRKSQVIVAMPMLRRFQGRPHRLIFVVISLLTAAPCTAQGARQWAAARSIMVESEVASAGIKSPAILAVMRTVPRHEFVPAEVRRYAYMDMALPIGDHQTISPPFVVAWMTQKLDPHPTDRVLEIGTGSGYQAAVLSGLVRNVYTIEIIKPVAERARQTFKHLGYKNVEIKIGDGYQGWVEHAPFDKMIVTCSPREVPAPLVEQLREGGRIVVPLGERYQQTLCSMVKHDGKLVVESSEPTFFVPMTGRAETLRAGQSEPPLTALVNGDFESLLDGDKPSGWYYVRQAAIETDGPDATSRHCIAFTNRVVGRSSQALQAIGVDGRRVSELVVELWVAAHDVVPAAEDEHGSSVLVSFFDENRVPVGQQSLGSWSGTFDWQRRSAHLKVPPAARVAIVAVGLLGATGELSCDRLSITMAGSASAARR
jgi:protein-L-isoaspartate(D-aspartate) O-methyltransferase